MAAGSLEMTLLAIISFRKLLWQNSSTFLLVPSNEVTTLSSPISEKRKPRSLLRNYGVYLVAWGRIELPTRGFST
jgi:hypothetical protein